MKYGLAIEEVVQTFFGQYQNEHSNATVKERGIFLDKELPFIGGIPDRIISCDCCGNSCLEVKCSISISFTSLMDKNANLPYLKGDTF